MILELSKLDESRKKIQEKYINSLYKQGLNGFKLMKPKKDFNTNGLRFDLDYLAVLGINLILLPVEVMVLYADKTTETVVKDNTNKGNTDIILSLSSFEISKHFVEVNCSTIGNLAYIYKHSNNQLCKEMARIILNDIHTMHLQNVSKQLTNKF